MALDLYWTSLLILVSLIALIAGHKTILSLIRPSPKEKQPPNPLDVEAADFQKTFLRVYLLVIASEWLQNPFTYPLLRHEKTLPESTVATLYITTYLTAALSSLFTGPLTDAFGRKRACLTFCTLHSLSSISLCFTPLWVLVLGRVLAGIALTLLWTSFESWLVTEYNARGYARSAMSLASLFGTMTTAKCLTAIFTGVVGHYVVLALGSRIHPFILGMALDLLAAVLMLETWTENRGTTPVDPDDAEEQKHTPSARMPSLRNPRVWALSFTTCCFEGTIFLFMFFWPETLQDAHDRGHPTQTSDPIPHGVIFACFMAIMVLGALSFNLLTGPFFICTVTPKQLLQGALLVSAVSFAIAALVRDETALFCSFLLLEVCNGIYVPSSSFHRGMIVTDDARARVYSLMNIPLFLFVVIALRMASGSAGHWQPVFMFCAGLLLIAALTTAVFLDVGNKHSDETLEDGGGIGPDEPLYSVAACSETECLDDSS